MLEEQPGERDPALLAAGQGRDVGVVGRAAQGVHRDVDVALEVPGVGGVDLVLERGLLRADGVVVGVRVGPFGHDGVVGVDQVLDRADAIEHVALDVLRRVELRLLAQVADREAGRQPGLAAEAVVEAGHDLEQARLAGAVRPDDADLGARIERDRDVLEDRPIGRVVPGELVRAVDEFGRHVRARVAAETRRRPPCISRRLPSRPFPGSMQFSRIKAIPVDARLLSRRPSPPARGSGSADRSARVGGGETTGRRRAAHREWVRALMRLKCITQDLSARRPPTCITR